MNSCLYECDIMHCRVKPRRHKFTHRIFMFYLDLDELDDLGRKLFLFARNRWNMFSFRDSDHLQIGPATVKENILKYLKEKGVNRPIGRVMLLTNVRTMGYVFNPVSFYFCFDFENQPVCVVAEIGNTFGELKPFLIKTQGPQEGSFESRETKYFYISPFVDMDVPMHFRIQVPDERLNIKIDDIKDNEKFLFTTMSGPQKVLTNASLFKYAICFPLVTLKVIFLIHFHALMLYLKKITFHAKESNPDLQREVYRAWVKK